MALSEIKSFIVDCDHCEAILEHNNYTIFPDDSSAMQAANDEEWIENDDGDYYCDKCATVNPENGAITLDETRRSLHAVKITNNNLKSNIMNNPTIGVQLIATERQKQIDKHGFTAEHHVNNPEWYDKEQLAYAAHSLLSLESKPVMYIKEPDNWDKEWFIKILKEASADKKYRYKVAGALIAAELDRIIELEK